MSFGPDHSLPPVEIVIVVCPACCGDQGYYIDVDLFVACGECNGSGEVEIMLEGSALEEAPSIDWSGYALISAPIAAYIDDDEIPPRKPPKRAEPTPIPRRPITAVPNSVGSD
jgi:hypothetical protein